MVKTRNGKCMKTQKSVRKELEPLIQWVNFVNAEQDCAPGVGLAFTHAVRVFADDPSQDRVELKLPGYANSLRQEADNILRQLAELVRSLPAGREWLLHRDLELSARPRRLLLVGHHLKGIEATIVEGDAPLDGLIKALTCRIDRLRICPCGKLFVAVNIRAEYCDRGCSNRLRQKKFYTLNMAEQRKVKLARYHVNRIRTAAARQYRARRTTQRVLQ
jgi:hypothetical protein